MSHSPLSPFPSRRRFLQWTGAVAATGLLGGEVAVGAKKKAAKAKEAQSDATVVANVPASSEKKFPFRLGIASYTFRKFDLAQTIAWTNRLGIKYLCLKSSHLPLDATPEKCAEVAEQIRKAGLVLYGGGTITMKKEADVSQAFDYAKAAGMKVMIASPVPDVLPLINEKVQQYDIAIAIHNHGHGDKDYPTPQSVYEKIKDLDKRVGLCVDIGHTVRIVADLLDSMRQCADRILDVHLKDVTAASKEGKAAIAGRGVIDLPAVIRLLREINYQGIASFEYEAGLDEPLPGLAESIGYVRGIMAAS